MPASAQEQLSGWMFGCDICQDVCPWNRFSNPHQKQELQPLHEILQFSLSDWNELQENSFRKIFKDSPLKRTKFSGIKRNLQAIKKTADNEG